MIQNYSFQDSPFQKTPFDCVTPFMFLFRTLTLRSPCIALFIRILICSMSNILQFTIGFLPSFSQSLLNLHISNIYNNIGVNHTGESSVLLFCSSIIYFFLITFVEPQGSLIIHHDVKKAHKIAPFDSLDNCSLQGGFLFLCRLSAISKSIRIYKRTSCYTSLLNLTSLMMIDVERQLLQF